MLKRLLILVVLAAGLFVGGCQSWSGAGPEAGSDITGMEGPAADPSTTEPAVPPMSLKEPGEM